MALSLSKVLSRAPSRDRKLCLQDSKLWVASARLYILRLKSGQLYIGSTKDLGQRYKDHCPGKACRTTKLDPPVALIHSEEFETFGEARKREAQIKRWTRAKKEALASGDLTKLKDLSKSRAR